MGTSQSGKAPGSNVPLVPPWAEDAVDDSQATPIDDSIGADDSGAHDAEPAPLAKLSSDARFMGASRRIASFAQNGDTKSLRYGLAQYVSKGYGGSASFSRRMGGTASRASRLNGVLQSGRNPDGSALIDRALATADNAYALMDAIVQAVTTRESTQDSESARHSVTEALSEVLVRYPDADLSRLSEDQRLYAVERFTAEDVFQRFRLDMHQVIVSNTPDPLVEMSRLEEIRSYISEAVSAAFRKSRARLSSPSSASIASLTRAALRETFDIFQEYLQ